jgi:mono/diheme cytochrome c family protein
MREKWARLIALFTGFVVLVLAGAFAVIQNPVETAGTTEIPAPAPLAVSPESVAADAERIEAGRRVYQQQTCARCHYIAGSGNPRNSLDGVGARRPPEELRDWIIGSAAVQELLPEHVFKVKQAYQLSDDELGALVIYLQSRSMAQGADRSGRH